jgi:hypothetical protein
VRDGGLRGFGFSEVFSYAGEARFLVHDAEWADGVH